MNSENATTQPNPDAPMPTLGLSQLHKVKLSDQDEAFLKSLAPRFAGSPRWRVHKEKMTRDLLALGQITNRVTYHWFDVTGDFRVLFDLKVTVPCLPDPRGSLQIAPSATLGLTYREAAMTTPQPGYVFVSIIQPRTVWLANCARDFGQQLCLGPKLDAGISAIELIVISYLALTLQSFQFDERDSAGILHAEAARWWQHNIKLIPLSNEPFITRTTPTTNTTKP